MLSRSYPGAADALATIASSAVAADTNVGAAAPGGASRCLRGLSFGPRAAVSRCRAGQGRIVACLTAHPDQLSPMCAAGMARAAMR
jgi:hypothetical protein